MERWAPKAVDASEIGLSAEPADAVDDYVDELPWFPDPGHRLDLAEHPPAGRDGPALGHV